MNGYIINPSWFYWLGVVRGLRAVGVALLVISAVGVLVLVVTREVDYDECDKEDEGYKALTRWLKTLSVAVIVCLFAVVFIPSRDTLIEMQVARFATYENAQWTVESIKSAVDYIVDAIKSLK